MTLEVAVFCTLGLIHLLVVYFCVRPPGITLFDAYIRTIALLLGWIALACVFFTLFPQYYMVVEEFFYIESVLPPYKANY